MPTFETPPPLAALGADVSPLSAHVGVEIRGLDLAAPTPADAAKALKALYRDHHLLLIRAPDLAPEDQARFARLFGETAQRERGRTAAADADNQYVSNVRADGVLGLGELDFHLDQLFLEEPLKALILYAVEVPAEGGDTHFVNSEAVYDAMSDDLKARIDDKRCLHARAYDAETTKGWNVLSAEEDAPSYVHPLAPTNPETGRRAIWVNKLTTMGVEGMAADAGAALIAEVREGLYDAALGYRHSWTPGDLILWNNRVLQHARTPFDPMVKRTLRRTALL